MSERGLRNLETENLNVREATDDRLADVLRNIETKLQVNDLESWAFRSDIRKIRDEQNFRKEMAKENVQPEGGGA